MHQVSRAVDIRSIGVASGAAAQVVSGGDVEQRVNAIERADYRLRISQVSMHKLDWQTVEVSLVAVGSDEGADFGAGVECGTDDVSADEAVGSR